MVICVEQFAEPTWTAPAWMVAATVVAAGSARAAAQRGGEEAEVGGGADLDAAGRAGGVVERGEEQAEGAGGGDPLGRRRARRRTGSCGRGRRRSPATGRRRRTARRSRRRHRRRRRAATRSATGAATSPGSTSARYWSPRAATNDGWVTTTRPRCRTPGISSTGITAPCSMRSPGSAPTSSHAARATTSSARVTQWTAIARPARRAARNPRDQLVDRRQAGVVEHELDRPARQRPARRPPAGPAHR